MWVIVDRLIKTVHFLPIRTTDSTSKLPRLYVDEIVRFHGVPSSIVSDRDLRFTSHFWENLQETLGFGLYFNTAYHPQTDGQLERTIQTLKDMLRACVLDFSDNWYKYLPLYEFTYSNNYHSSIGMLSYATLYDRPCCSLSCWSEVRNQRRLELDFIQETIEKVAIIRKNLATAESCQKNYADNRRQPLEFAVGDQVFLMVFLYKGKMQFGKRGKLSPHYVGPFQIIERIGPVAYRLTLSPEFTSLYDVFHVLMLKMYYPNPFHIIPYIETQIQADMTCEEILVEILGWTDKVLRNKMIPMVKVQ